MRTAAQKSTSAPSPVLVAVGALLAVLAVFLLLPVVVGIQEDAKPDVTVRDVDLIELPKPPDEPDIMPEATAEAEVAAPTPELSAQTESVRLAPLAVEGSGPAMPAAAPGELGLPEFTLANAPAAMPEVFELNEVDVRPVPLVQTPPTYPWELRRARVEGQAVMTFTIGADGAPQDIEVESATHESFGKASADAIKNWRFKPGEKGGQTVKCSVRIAVPFNLR